MMLRIRNWDKWQTYRKDRPPPPWIKIYRRLLMDPNFMALTDGQKGQLLAMWILAADKGGEIPDDPLMLRKICGMDENPDIDLFVTAGFLERVSIDDILRIENNDLGDGCHDDNHEPTKNQFVVAPEAEAEAEAKAEADIYDVENWSPDRLTQDACDLFDIGVTDHMVATFRLKMMDWKDKNWRNVNVRNKFLEHCRSIQEAEGTTTGRTGPTTWQELGYPSEQAFLDALADPSNAPVNQHEAGT